MNLEPEHFATPVSFAYIASIRIQNLSEYHPISTHSMASRGSSRYLLSLNPFFPSFGRNTIASDNSLIGSSGGIPASIMRKPKDRFTSYNVSWAFVMLVKLYRGQYRCQPTHTWPPIYCFNLQIIQFGASDV